MSDTAELFLYRVRVKCHDVADFYRIYQEVIPQTGPAGSSRMMSIFPTDPVTFYFIALTREEAAMLWLKADIMVEYQSTLWVDGCREPPIVIPDGDWNF